MFRLRHEVPCTVWARRQLGPCHCFEQNSEAHAIDGLKASTAVTDFAQIMWACNINTVTPAS